MGTGTNDTDLKAGAKTRSFIMAKLYRGFLDILRIKHDGLSNALITHIRNFDKPAEESDYAYVESMGFWRMLVELIFSVYVQLSLFVGIALVVALVICAWPIRFIVEMFTGSWFMKLGNYHYQPHPEDQLPPVQEEPVLDDKNSKVVRRVVYEETKVPKK